MAFARQKRIKCKAQLVQQKSWLFDKNPFTAFIEYRIQFICNKVSNFREVQGDTHSMVSREKNTNSIMDRNRRWSAVTMNFVCRIVHCSFRDGSQSKFARVRWIQAQSGLRFMHNVVAWATVHGDKCVRCGFQLEIVPTRNWKYLIDNLCRFIALIRPPRPWFSFPCTRHASRQSFQSRCQCITESNLLAKHLFLLHIEWHFA